MNILYLILISITFQLISTVQSNDEDNKELVFVKNVEDEQQSTAEEFKVSDELFIPTSEWQTLKKDQGVPRGIHLRLNIQTGEKEGKLLDGTVYIDGRIFKTDDIVTRSQKKLQEALEQLNDEKSNIESEQKVF